MKTVDTTGLTCPGPLIMLKEALTESAAGESIKVLTDNETSLKNMITYLKDQGGEAQVSKNGQVHTIVTSKPEKDLTESDPAAYCSTETVRIDYVVCLKCELMGDGDPELGKILMSTFLENLKLQERLPTNIVLYNSGVKLALKGTDSCASLAELEEMGCRITLCGTCIDHFGIQYEIGVGMISNIVSITETLADAGHIIYP
jgi:selenium metabolism protein YedF